MTKTGQGAGTAICSHCNHSKPLTEEFWYHSGSGKWRTECKECYSTRYLKDSNKTRATVAERDDEHSSSNLISHEVTKLLLGRKRKPEDTIEKTAKALGKSVEWVKAERKRLTLLLETKAQSGAAGKRKHKRSSAPVDIGEKPEFGGRVRRIGVKRLKNTGKHKRAAIAGTEVVQTHKKDQNIMARIFGGKTRLEENFVDVITNGVYREHKPDVNMGDIHKALGKLWAIKRTMKPKAFGLITRRKLSAAIKKLFTDMGAFVELLTSDNKVVRQ